MSYPLEPDRAEAQRLGDAVLARVLDFLDGLPERPASRSGDEVLLRQLLASPPEQPGQLDALLDRLDEAADAAVETAGGNYFGFVPGGGVVSSAAAELYTRSVNRYGGMAGFAPALVALEQGVLRWPPSAGSPRMPGES